MINSDTKRRLIALAEQVAANAYAPYSGFRVGAALLGKSGRIYTGCNVENASYGLSICAERAAVLRAIAEGETGFAAIAIWSSATSPCPPCGACRQVLAEFSARLVVISAAGGKIKTYQLSSLLPARFTFKKGKRKIP
jgi:cytidine deaminase